jgi:Ran GTPase-activating protein (RanGAP) involved in mRNA processing and transport
MLNEPSLTTLRVPATESVGRENMRMIITSLKANTHVKEVCFRAGSLSMDLMVTLAYSLRSNTTVKKLSFEHVTLMGARHLFEALRDNHSIDELSLVHNDLEETSTDALASLLKGHDSLTKLTMKHNYVGNALGAKHCLQQVELQKCWGCASGIQEMMKQNRTIKQLYLIHSEVDARKLFEQLKHDTVLEELVITGTAFTSDAAASLATLLRETRTLQKLRFWGTRLGDAHLQTISQGLEYNKSISELRIIQNRIGCVGASALATALLSNTTIQELDLSDNDIGDDGAKDLLDLMKRNARVESLTVRGNKQMDKAIAAEIMFYAKLNKTLKVGGRDAIRDVSLPYSLWPSVLDRVKMDPRLLNFVIRQRPEVFGGR